VPLYKVQKTSNLKHFTILLASLKDKVMDGLQGSLPIDQSTDECLYKVQAIMVFVSYKAVLLNELIIYHYKK
jgi:hypothetical protein